MLSMAEGPYCIDRNAIENCDSIEGFDPAKPDDGLYRRVPRVYTAVLRRCDDAMHKLAFLGRATVEVPVVSLNTSCICPPGL